MGRPGERTRFARELLECAAQEIREDGLNPGELGIAVAVAGDVVAALHQQSARLGVPAPDRLLSLEVDCWALRLLGLIHQRSGPWRRRWPGRRE